VARDRAAQATAADQLRAVQTALGAIRTMYLVALDGAPIETIAHPADPADKALSRAQQAAKLRAALARLPERERLLLHAHYVDGKTLLDAGAELGMSKSWASRLHARAIDQLRELLAEPG
jgi:RNA polymerase sigma factor for flagellar operon FliA